MDVSIIIPTFNRLWCLPRAISSCRQAACQTEIIVIDDGSTDGTWEWLCEQPDIVAVRQKNQGQTYAINHGVKISTGRYIRFLDSDDFLASGTIDRQFQRACLDQAQVVCSKVDLFYEVSQKVVPCPEITHWKDFLEIQLGNTYGSHFLGMLFERKLVEQTPRRPDFALREDRMFLLEIALLNPKIIIDEGCAGYWVQHDYQMQANYSGFKSQVANWQHLQIYKRILNQLETEHRLTELYKNAACTVLWPLAHWIAKDHFEAAREVCNWIYQLAPDFKVPHRGLLGSLYKTLGFTRTERLLQIRRIILFK